MKAESLADGDRKSSGTTRFKVCCIENVAEAKIAVRHGAWAISRRIRETVDVPVFLAGGLTPENVAEAVRLVGPFGVDVCSGLRTHGHLDGANLARFAQSLSTP